MQGEHSKLKCDADAPSEGCAELPWKRLSGKDAARDAMGQGWPFAACLCSGDSGHEPAGPDAGASGFGYFSQEKSGSPGKGETLLKVWALRPNAHLSALA
ncbi:hypothetical protein AO726_07140 [Pseudomonas sp. TTU2014-080ASC]|nr:hypothetical protein AO726_07140 [Pseudomonas sp. TTU2014-080ASC]